MSRYKWDAKRFRTQLFRYKRVGTGHWNKISNQRAFLEELAVKLSIISTHHILTITDIQENKDWYKITLAELQQSGGAGLYKRYLSMSKLFMTVYPEYHIFNVHLHNVI